MTSYKRNILVWWDSPGHPTADGRTLAELKVNDLLDGADVISMERLSYTGIATYDILPSGETVFYWANGILMGSTLSQSQGYDQTAIDL